MRKREIWVDIARFIGIIGMMLDHTYTITYQSYGIACISYYALGLYILLSGYNAYQSWSHKPYGLKKVWKKCLAMLVPYTVATFIYDWVDDYTFSFEEFLFKWIHFNANMPLYYVFLFIQLIIIGPILCYVVRENSGVIRTILVLLAVSVIAIPATNCTNILSIYGAGGKLFGGTLIIFYTLGMYVAKHRDVIDKLGRKTLILIPIFVICMVRWVLFITQDQLQIEAKSIYHTDLNPAGISTGLYAILLFTIILFMDVLFKTMTLPVWLEKVAEFFAYLGRHTIYFFMYHQLFLYYFHWFLLRSQLYTKLYDNIIFRCIWLYGIMIVGPLAIEHVLKWAKGHFVNAYVA